MNFANLNANQYYVAYTLHIRNVMNAYRNTPGMCSRAHHNEIRRLEGKLRYWRSHQNFNASSAALLLQNCLAACS